jgi:hypothetical protein
MTEVHAKLTNARYFTYVALGLAFVVGLFFLVNYLLDGPLHPDSATGHLYALSNRGTVIYLTRTQYYGNFALIVFFAVLVLILMVRKLIRLFREGASRRLR